MRSYVKAALCISSGVALGYFLSPEALIVGLAGYFCGWWRRDWLQRIDDARLRIERMAYRLQQEDAPVTSDIIRRALHHYRRRAEEAERRHLEGLGPCLPSSLVGGVYRSVN